MVDVVEDLTMECGENPVIPTNPDQLAETKKESGNQLFKVKQYRSALPFYTEAINLCPEIAAYYGNRSACYIMLQNYREALEDARKSIQLDQLYLKGYQRILKCSIALGDLMTAENTVKTIKILDTSNNSIQSELKSLEILKQYETESHKALEKRDYRKVVYCMDRCLDQTPTCARYKIMKAECLAFLGRYQEAQELANGILHVDKSNADAIYVRGICLFYEDNIDSAVNHFQQVLRLAPDNAKAIDAYKRAKALKKKKEDGNVAYRACKFQEAINLYTEALSIDPLNKKTNSKLYFNRATVSARLCKFKDAVLDCTAALNLDDTYIKALLRRAKCYMELSEYEEAVHDYERACKMDKSRDNKKLLQDAKLALKKSKRKDYYKILGVDRNASDDEIKKAYRKKALLYHPDRHANATDAEKKEQEKKFKELGEAYSVLSNPGKKARYDSGQDIEDCEGGLHADIDPSQVFHSFFGGNGGHGTTEFNFGSSNGFPGGFTFQFG